MNAPLNPPKRNTSPVPQWAVDQLADPKTPRSLWPHLWRQVGPVFEPVDCAECDGNGRHENGAECETCAGEGVYGNCHHCGAVIELGDMAVRVPGHEDRFDCCGKDACHVALDVLPEPSPYPARVDCDDGYVYLCGNPGCTETIDARDVECAFPVTACRECDSKEAA